MTSPISRWERWKKWRRTARRYCIALLVYLSSIRGAKCCCSSGRRKNIIAPGLWTNACCSHPRPGEDTREAAALRRLREELGFTTNLEKLFEFTYRTAYDNGLTEFEFDHVFVGIYDQDISPDQAEVSDYRYQSLQEIEAELEFCTRRPLPAGSSWLFRC